MWESRSITISPFSLMAFLSLGAPLSRWLGHGGALRQPNGRADMARYTHFKVWLDGKIVNPEEATLSVFTLTVLRGASVYEGLRAYWNSANRDLYVWKLDEHLKRLGQSMKVMRMQLPYSLDDLRVAVVEWLRANDFHDDVHFRLVAYFGDGGSAGVKSYRPDEIDTGAFILGGPRPHDAKLERGLAMGVATWRASQTTWCPRGSRPGRTTRTTGWPPSRRARTDSTTRSC